VARRKLLLVTYHFPPSAASGTFRMLGFVRHLPRFGWAPVVVAPPHSLWDPSDEGLGRQVPADVPVYRVPFPRGPAARVARRLVPNAMWLPRALAACARAIQEHRPDVILTSSPPPCVHLVGRVVKRRYRLPWAADFRDPWIATTPRAAGRTFWDRLEARSERALMRAADVVLANAPRACAALRAAFPAHAEKMRTLTNGFDPENFPAPNVRRPSDGPLTLLHAGEVYAGRDPRPLLDALAALGSAGDAGRPVRLCFLGQVTVQRCDLGEEVRRRGLEGGVVVEPHAPYAGALARMAAADILLLLDSPGRRIGVPAKLYEHLGAGRPVLALAEPDGDTAWALRASGAVHRTVTPTDNVGIGRALLELVEIVRRGTAAVSGDRARAFTREHLAGVLAGILDGCLEARAVPARVCRVAGGVGAG
jgi:glycosyltransferase involved in cell wall biosynthesis